MLIAIVLDKPLSEAQALVDNPDAFLLEITKIIQNKHAHPVIAQMLHPDVRDDLPPSECAPASSDFFSSGVADHTLRLGPYVRRSCDQVNFNMDTGGRMKHGKSKQPNHKPKQQKARRRSPSQICVQQSKQRKG